MTIKRSKQQNNNLRSLIEALIKESGENGEGLAISVKKSSDEIICTVYNPQETVNSIKQILQASDKQADDVKYELEYTLGNFVKGFLIIRKPEHQCNDAWEIKMIAGEGRVMYSLAYSLSPTGKIMPDRSAVSKTARAAWNKVGASGKVAHKDLDDVNNPKTAPKQDDCDVWGDSNNENGILDRAYQLKSNPVNVKSLHANHEKFIKWFENAISESDYGFDIEIDEKDVEQIFSSARDSFFSSSYKKNRNK